MVKNVFYSFIYPFYYRPYLNLHVVKIYTKQYYNKEIKDKKKGKKHLFYSKKKKKLIR